MLSLQLKRAPGHKKIADIERELKKLQGIQHPNLAVIFATCLDHFNSIPRLTILLDQRCSVTLKDVLMFSDGLRQERALVGAGGDDVSNSLICALGLYEADPRRPQRTSRSQHLPSGPNH